MPRITMVPATFWQPFRGEHRCSSRFCYRPAVLRGEGTRTRYTSTPWTTHTFNRYLCAHHATSYGLVYKYRRWWHRYAEPWPLSVFKRARDFRERGG